MLSYQPSRAAKLFFVALLAMFTLPAVASSGPITVTRVSGSVTVLSGQTRISISAGTLITPPARIETGADGFLRIEQASSNLDIGPNSALLIPGADADSENIIQNLGRVLYSVKPRKSRSFSVQTPYLVSVVKGTVFSVAIEKEATTVALMEGSVELVAEGIAPVLLLPNDTARRGQHEQSISVTKVDVSAPTAGAQATVLGSNSMATDPTNPAASTTASDAPIAALNEVTAAQRLSRSTIVPESPSSPTTPASPVPESPPPAAPPGTPTTPVPSTPEPPSPGLPPPDSPTTPPVPNVPGTQPEMPLPDEDDHDHDPGHEEPSSCTRERCDSDDDHDRGRGNDRK